MKNSIKSSLGLLLVLLLFSVAPSPVALAVSSESMSSEQVLGSRTQSTTETTASTADASGLKSEATSRTITPKAATQVKPLAANDPVNIPDPVLRGWIIFTLKHYHGQVLNEGDPITEAQMAMIKSMYRVNREGIADLTGLEYAVNLENLDFVGNPGVPRYFDSFTQLPTGFSNLTKLKTLKFYYGELANIDELKNHPNLVEFSAEGNKLSSLEGLTGCTKLEKLNINGSDNYTYGQNGGIQNFKGLEQAVNLKEITFKKYDEETGITRVPVGTAEPSYVGYGLQSLEGLNCADSLEVLDLKGHPGLHNLDGLENYTKLKTLKVVGAVSYNGRRPQYNVNNVEDPIFDPATHPEMYHTRGLRGTDAIASLKTCTSLETVDLSRHALTDISPLSGNTNIKYLELGYNLLATISPLRTTNQIIKLTVEHNLLKDLDGIQDTATLEELNCRAQTTGATDIHMPPGDYVTHNLKGLLKDITAINPTSIKRINCADNCLESLSGFENATNLTFINASNNNLANTVGEFDGCIALNEVWLNNNRFVEFKNIGLDAAKNSLEILRLKEQGWDQRNETIKSNADSILDDIDGLQAYSVLKLVDLNSNILKDAQMGYIPESIENMSVSFNLLGDKAFNTFTPAKYQNLTTLNAESNNISDVSPLEDITTLKTLNLRDQYIYIPKNGGSVTVRKFAQNGAEPGFDLDVLKTKTSDQYLTVEKSSSIGWGTATVKPKNVISNAPADQTSIIQVDDPDYSLYSRSPAIKFSYSRLSLPSTNANFTGVVIFDANYQLNTAATITIDPTDVSGAPLTEVENGEYIYWRITLKGKDAKYLMNPTVTHHLQYTDHTIATAYSTDAVGTDPKAAEYQNGYRVELDDVYLALADSLWSNTKIPELDRKINEDHKAVMTVVTKVGTTANPGDEISFYTTSSGVNYSSVNATGKVKVKSSAPEELALLAPKYFDFGHQHESSKKQQIYSLDTNKHTSKEQTDGFTIRVTDSMRGNNRTDWKVVGQLSELKASNKVLKNASEAAKLSLSDISLAKITVDNTGNESAQNVVPGTSGVPTWQQTIDLVAGGASVELSRAPLADGEGVWRYQIPFDKVKLTVPSNINDKAGFSYQGKVTWTLDDTL